MNLSCRRIWPWIFLFLSYALFAGCLSELADDTPLALVNNEPVTYAEFKKELQGLHLMTKEKRGVGIMDLKGFMDKLIRKRLFIQEAIRTGLDKDPDVQAAMDAELQKQAIMNLHRDEVDNKVTVSDDEVWEEYSAQIKKHREYVEEIRKGFSIDPNGRPENAKNHLSGLRKMAKIEIDPNFVWQGEGACDPNSIMAMINGKVLTCPQLSQAIHAVKNGLGEETGWEFAFQWLIDEELLRQDAERYVSSRDSFEKTKDGMMKRMVKERRQEREDAYIEELRQKAKTSKVSIDPNRLLDEGMDPNQPVVWVNGDPITLSELRSGINTEEFKTRSPEDRKRIMEKREQYLIDCCLVEKDALGRGYENLPDVRKVVAVAREMAIYNKFFRGLLIPSIKITDEEVENYYQGHKDQFRTPIHIKADEIRVKTEGEAARIWSELEAGADFEFLTKRSLPQRITSQHWFLVDRIVSPGVKDGLTKAKEGEMVGPISWEEGHSIFLIKRREGGEQIPFEGAQKDAKDALWKERYENAIKRWDEILRASSEIVIYEERLNQILSAVKGKGDED